MKNTLIGLLLFIPVLTFGQLKYPPYSDLVGAIKSIRTSGIASQSSIGKSFAGEDIPVIKLQLDDAPKPTLLIVAGIDGKHPSGPWSTIKLAKQLLGLPKDSIQSVLKEKSIWIIPVLNPDAYKRNVNSISWASGNGRQIDNDRDGRIDEDLPKDLNNDGIISQMRISSSIGNYKLHKDRPNILVSADKSKSERGQFIVLEEGIDQDFDGKYGEDGLGGVNIDRNFTFEYPAFMAESGTYAASEPETKAVVDFIFANPQIASVLHIGLVNNLSDGEKFDANRANQRIVKSWTSNDADVSKFISSIYKESTKVLGNGPKIGANAGDFTNTAYYHLGKFSFATPLWWPTVLDSTKNTVKHSSDANETFYEWVKQNNIQGAILPWQKINHPDFPNATVEVGGEVDIFRNNPPIEYLDSAIEPHTNFVLSLLNNMAKLVFEQPKVTLLGNDVFRVELSVMNVGAMPTYPEIADRIRYVSRFKTICDLQSNQQFLSGKRLQLYSTLSAGGSQKFSWLIKGKGAVKIKAGCPTSGEKTIEVKL